MAVDKTNYDVVWKFMPEGWANALSKRTAPGVMPYFVDGEDRVLLEEKKEVHLNESMLLKGILYSWFEPDKYMEPTGEQLEGFLLEILEFLRVGFSCGSVEQMILDVALRVREENGHLPASTILMAGNNILPSSSKIRSDLIMDVWMTLEETEGVDRKGAFEMITKCYEGIDFQEIDYRVIESLDYMYLVALSQLGRHGLTDEFYKKVASQRISNRELKMRAKKILNNSTVDFDELKVWNA